MMKKLLYAFVLLIALAGNSANAQFSAITSREPQLSIFPQPATTQLNISFGDASFVTAQFKLYDLLGNLVADVNTERNESGNFTINVADRKPGYYFIKIITEEGTFSRRITVKP